MSSTFNYINASGGTSGVIIASRLSQYLPSARIALLEADPNAVDHPKSQRHLRPQRLAPPDT
jgi:hypothetical protein